MNIRIIIHDNENMTLQVFYMLHEINQIEFKHKKKIRKSVQGHNVKRIERSSISLLVRI